MRGTVIPSSLSRHNWLFLALAVFFLALSVSYYRKVADDPQGFRSAIYRWQNQLRDLADGANIWEKHHYPNPPIMALILMPLAKLPHHVGAMVWFYLKCAIAMLALHWIFRVLERDGTPVPFLGKVLVLVLGLRLLAGDLTHGNVNLFIFFVVVAFLCVLLLRHDFKAGMLLALAIACKLTPALFLPYLVWKRAWCALTGASVGLVLFFFVVPGLFLGMSHNVDCLRSWADTMVRPYLMDGKVTTEYANQSLPGLVHRLASQSPSFVVETYTEVVPVEYHNLLSMERKTLSWIIRACMLVFAGLVMWSCRRPITTRTGWLLLAEASVVAIGMLLFSERTWKHHCVTMLIPFAVLSYVLFACGPGVNLRWHIIVTLTAVFLLMTATSSGLFPGHDRLGRLAQVYGAYVWANILLIAALIAVLRHDWVQDAAVKRQYAVLSLRAMTEPTEADAHSQLISIR
ncbi:MAG: DUF2029 domain-containing protein [Planctomycetes bacterium]|nr:DUF2029 domain-containing protein [Planctomycetota bacterium]